MQDRTDPIIAISTAPGKGAVGIVRISGHSLEGFTEILTKTKLEEKKVRFIKLKDTQGELIDEVLCIFFKGPNSYTGEDILEIQGHGGPIVLQRIVKHCLKISKLRDTATQAEQLPYLRIARPGEYSERAFLNNKIDLLQAEAIIDLIDASTEQASLGASRSLSGEFSKNIKDLLSEITQTRVFIEAHIDFPEEEIGALEIQRIKEKLTKEIDISNKLLARTKNGLLLKEGINTVITGQPNAGKSSIMNALCQQDVSIVTDIEGTTRDLVRQHMQVDGIPINLIDTAGINFEKKDKIDPVEKIGIEKAWKELHTAELVIFVHDISRVFEKTYIETSLQILKEIERGQNKNTKLIHILNKSDLINENKDLELAKTYFDKLFQVNTLILSTKSSGELQKLRERILNDMGWSKDNSENVHLARSRHLQSIIKVKEHLEVAVSLFDSKILSLELIAEEMRLVQNALSEITGEYSSDDLLGEIFSTFCIGK